MKPLSNKNKTKLQHRIATNVLRMLKSESGLIDFSSNDYLGFSKSTEIFDAAHQYLIDNNIKRNGATGSRLLSGNHNLYTEVETMLCEFHESEAALIFNSGYDANIGFFSSVPQRGDIILYDEFIHASIRDGITMSNAKSYKFKHNDLSDLEEKILRFTKKDQNSQTEFVEVYVVTESIFSMDGDSPDLMAFAGFCSQNDCHLVVDEAHAIGVLGEYGCGEVQKLEIGKDIFARIITFGKAFGCHGAAILGSSDLKQYLVNFARSFIYTTALPPHSLATIKASYNVILSPSPELRTGFNEESQLKKLHINIRHFKSEIKRLNLDFIISKSAIHCCIIKGNEHVKSIAERLQENGFDVKPILSPTVPAGQERLRFCLHSYNSKKEMSEVLTLLSTFVAYE